MPLHKLGEVAIRELLNALDGEPPGDRMVRTAPVLVERNSVSQY
jgi:DNA-binding LacI/PurR family transcriptional regulator